MEGGSLASELNPLLLLISETYIHCIQLCLVSNVASSVLYLGEVVLQNHTHKTASARSRGLIASKQTRTRTR